MTRHSFSPALFLLVAAPLSAHDFWIEPSSYRPSAGTALTVRLMEGEHFRGDPVARNDARIERFVIRGRDGVRAIAGATGDEPAGRIDRIAPGDAVVGYRTRPRRHGSMTAARFEAYLAEEGLEHVIALRARRGDSKRGASEIFSRSAKSLLRTRRSRFDEPLGFRFEIVPETDPSRDALTVRLLFDGQPLSGTRVTAMHRDDKSLTVQRRSDAQGRVTLPVAKNGAWLIKAVHMVAAPEGSGADWESIWATLTFERGP